MTQPLPIGRRIGLTGGIGMGKTTISDYLHQAYALPILDADIYAREAVTAGSQVLTQLVNHYGTEILLSDGGLNRQQLSQIIFQDPHERQWVEQQIHPYVYDRFCQDIRNLSNQLLLNAQAKPTLVLAIPLWFEANMTDLVTEIWVVACEPAQQLERLRQRNPNLTSKQIQSRIDSQWPIAEKIARADVVLKNTSTLENLYTQIDRAMTINSTVKASVSQDTILQNSEF